MTTWNPRANDLFLKALDLPSPGKRREFLDGACGGDAAFRADVEALLEANDKAGSFLQSSAPLPAASIDAPASAERPGTVIGPYKLLQQLGEGGMGVVFMAEQTHPVQRKVALKVIKLGMDSRQVIARFEAERQALALMDHVNIARVLDAGATATGRPYFVMELVHGMPITDYCDDNHLTPRERLELFVPVCHAVQHAHQKGIIHRDIKPSNVMITLYDGKPVPKVIDFGVAKATEQKLTERTLFTQYGTMVGTLEYMSPEQAEMSALGIDTRSDIYSLGVLLYELLTGDTPLNHKRFKAAAHAEILRMIKEEEPPKPSTRLSDSGEDLASISANRHMEPAKLTKLVRGELDWIVMKCIEKDRNRRYETANGFAMDVQRYLADEPVQACPPSAGYRLRKFVRRNRGPVLAAGLVSLAVIAGVIATSISTALLWREKERTRTAFERAEANLVLALEALDQVYLDEAQSHPEIREGLPRDLLQKGLGFYEKFAKENTGNPGLVLETGDARLSAGLIFRELGEEGAAVESLEKAISAYDQALVVEPLLSAAHANRGTALNDLGRVDEALAAFDRAIDIAPRDARLHNNRGHALRGLGRFEDSLAAFNRALDLSTKDAMAHNNRGVTLKKLGRVEEALAAYDKAIEIDQRDVLAHTNRASALSDLGRFEEALAACDQAIGIDPHSARAHGSRGHALEHLGRFEEALAAFDQAVAIDPRNILAVHNRAVVLRHLSRFEEALAAFDRALVIDPLDTQSHYNRGVLLCDLLGRPGEALAAFDRALDLDPRNAGTRIRRGAVLCDHLGRPGEALAEFDHAIELDQRSAVAHCNRGIALRNLLRFEESLAACDRAIEIDTRYALAHAVRGLVLGDLRRLDEALLAFDSAVDFDPQNADGHNSRGCALRDLSRLDDALEAFDRAIAIDAGHANAHFNRGNTLSAMGEDEAAIEAFGEAIRLQRNFAEAHCNLGHAFMRLGRYQEALPCLRTGHELGSRRPGWPYPSGKWVEDAERRAELQGRLDLLLSQKAQPRDGVERIELALALYNNARHAESAQMYAEAFAEDAALAEAHRYNAACSASLAAARAGANASEWRGRALEWLRADLAALERVPSRLAFTLEHWKSDSDLAAVRDRLGELPKAEREAWLSLWAAVDRALTAAPRAAK